ncbi:hypothetical protein MM440_04845 [Arsenicicoccus piscis]|nr:DUF6541 family protein [Arsenicicoccus piscis]MCH8627129.1 hypothetical protein [Arsenicicoccus piscis]
MLPCLAVLLVVLAGTLALQRLVGSLSARRARARAGAATGASAWTGPPRWGRGAAVALAATVSVVATAVPIMLAIGEPWRPQQSNDSPFHYTAIWRVLTSGSASWDTVFATSSPGSRGFYPVGFHGFVALATQLSGQFLVVTTNVVVLALAALVWPLGLLAAVRALVPRSAAALWAVALLAPVVVSMPYLLLSFGALWPNVMGLTLLPGLVAAALAGSARIAGERRPGTGGVVGIAIVLALGVFAIVFAHPSVALNAVVVLGPLLLAVLGRLSVRAWRASRRGRTVVVVGWALLGVVGVVGLVVLLRVGASVAAAGSRNTQTFGGALWRALTLATPLSPGLLVLGVLALAGAARALVIRRHRWLVVAHVLTGVQFVLAGSTAGLPAAVLTGMWYRDAYRFPPVLALTALLLTAVAVEGLVDLVARSGVLARLATRGRGSGGPAVRRWAPVLVVLLVALAARAPFDSHSALRVVAQNYSRVGYDSELVSPAELRLYADVHARPRDRRRRDAGRSAGGPRRPVRWRDVRRALQRPAERRQPLRRRAGPRPDAPRPRAPAPRHRPRGVRRGPTAQHRLRRR